MKKLFLIPFFILSLFYGAAQEYPRQRNTHRLMSYNIHHGEGMDGNIDIERIGRLICKVNPEVVGLQEVDSITVRSGKIDILKLLAEQTGMYPAFGYSILHDGGKYGNGLLTREKPLSVKKIPLPGKKEARTALIVELSNYMVVNTHLSLDEKERIESAKILSSIVKNCVKPVFLMGDLNARPDSPPIQFLLKEWQILSDRNKPTSPSVNPRSTIDYIMGYNANGYLFERTITDVVDEQTASDHRPIFADIRISLQGVPDSGVMRTIPYLQNPGTNEMTVMWLTNVPARSWVEYGTHPDSLKRARTFIEGVMVANNKINQIRLTGLQPGTKYYYRVISQEITRYSSYKKTFGDTARSPLRSFTTWSDNRKNFRVIVYNDIHSNMTMFRKLHSLVDDKPYDLVIFNGDCFDDVEKESDIVNRLLTYTQSIRSDQIPSIFIRGNHETRGAYSLRLWNYLRRMGGRSYSAFSLGDTRFVLLDCGEDKPDDHWVYYDMNDFTRHRIDQAEFLKKELGSEPFLKADKRVLIHHIPIFGVDPGSYSPCSDLWKPVLENAPFNVSLNAHTHRYRVIEKGEDGNNFPVVIGGGNKEPGGTVMVLEKNGEELTLEVINAKGKRLLKRVL